MDNNNSSTIIPWDTIPGLGMPGVVIPITQPLAEVNFTWPSTISERQLCRRYTTAQLKDPEMASILEDEQQDFVASVRARAAELGILQHALTMIEPSATGNDQTDPSVDSTAASKFIVCDHCRSHGIRCNEASVCNQCIARDIPCTHRLCQVAPTSRELCTRQVCLYVHQDYMPGLDGRHNPMDNNWVILPGKLSVHLSRGSLRQNRLGSEPGSTVNHAGVGARQQAAKEDMARCVEAGEATWENVLMGCRCVQKERDERRARIRAIEQATERRGRGRN